MTGGDIRDAIESAIGAVPFESPVSVAYCESVRDVLRPMLPDGALIDSFHRHTELVVEARVGKVTYDVTLPLV